MNIMGWKIVNARKAYAPSADDNRPVKLVDDGYNSWRVVYADE